VATPHQPIDWAWAGSALDGRITGDAHGFTCHADGCLVALVDGLGHGPEAALAAQEAVRLAGERAGESLLDLLRHCHAGLRRTRGAVMGLASFRTSQSTMTWLGVGNVEGILFRRRTRRREALTPRPGVVGYQFQPPRMVVLPIAAGDLLVMATDGIRGHFADGVRVDDDVQQIASCLLDRYAKGTDDAHVVAARFLGAP
jgi:negative regulator of sigma-B (phosphoserine phosphatase)